MTVESLEWPKKHALFGVRVSATTYTEALEVILRAASLGVPAVVDFMPVHGLIEASSNPSLLEKINRFDIVAPDGQPVRWALNRLHGAGLADRVYGPVLMQRLCQRAAEEGLSVYLYGSTPETLRMLEANLVKENPGLIVAGRESPPFRKLTAAEDAATVVRMNASGASLVFLGLGCPKQEHFAYDHRNRIHAVQLCVGAAFDFIAGNKKTAPRWMQDRGLEWLFRLSCDPRRLWRRYLKTNTIFVWKVINEAIRPVSRQPATR